MLYELIKRDPAWKTTPFVALACGAALPVLAAAGAHHPGLLSSVLIGAPIFALSPEFEAQNAILVFQLALPISTRQIFLARVFSMVSLISLPALVGAAMIAMAYGAAGVAWSSGLLTIAATAPPFVLLTQLITLRCFGSLRFRHKMFCAVCFITPGLIAATGARLVPLLAAAVVSSAAVLFAIWNVIPKTIQLAPRKAPLAEAPAVPARRVVDELVPTAPADALMPVLRSVFSWMYFLYLAALFISELGRFTAMFIIVTFLFARAGTRWLQALPIRSGVLLAAIVMPILVVLTVRHAAGYAAGIQSWPWSGTSSASSPRMWILSLAVLIGWALLLLVLVQLSAWHRCRRLPRPLRDFWPAGVGFGVVAVGATPWFAQDPIPGALQRVSLALPDNALALIAVAALPLGALWWTLDRLFRESELSYSAPAARPAGIR